MTQLAETLFINSTWLALLNSERHKESGKRNPVTRYALRRHGVRIRYGPEAFVVVMFVLLDVAHQPGA